MSKISIYNDMLISQYVVINRVSKYQMDGFTFEVLDIHEIYTLAG